MVSHCLLLTGIAFALGTVPPCHEGVIAERSSDACLLSFGDLPVGFLPGLSHDQAVDVQAFMNALGTPTKLATSEPFEEHYSGRMTRAVTVDYPHIRLVAQYEDSKSLRDAYVESIVLSDPSRELPCGLRIGASINEFRRVLGEPNETETESPTDYLWEKFECRNGVTYAWHGTITLHPSTSGTVAAVEWSYWGD